jgi:predicted ATP-grasp superfamily ATP-dependent carboligase
MSKSVDVVEVNPIKKNKPSVVLGFSGAGFVGNTAGMYISRSKGYKMLAYLKSHLIPPMMLLIDGEPTHPFRIYGDEKNELLFVVSAVMIELENAWPIGLKLMEWLRDLGCREFVSIEGMPFTIPAEERPIFGFTIPERNLAPYGVRPINEGGVSGVSAVMLEEAIKHRIPWVTILVPTPITAAIDYGGASSAVEVLNKMYKLGVDPSPLQRSEEMIRQRVEMSRREQPRGFLDSFRRRRPQGSGAAGS